MIHRAIGVSLALLLVIAISGCRKEGASAPAAEAPDVEPATGEAEPEEEPVGEELAETEEAGSEEQK